MSDATLTIDLQDGFHDEHVTVTVAGRVLVDDELSTSLLTGLAGSVTVTVPAGATTVSTVVRGSEERCEVELGPDATCHLGIALADGTVSYRRSTTPFFYG